jgi:antitoxin component YwqK of YwqJK toxin-antitoxin module
MIGLRLIIIYFVLYPVSPLYSQLLKGVKSDIKFSDTIVNQEYGIQYFDKYSKINGFQQVRYCKNYPCQGWLEDYYENGQLLHKGFYNEGVLNNYKNYFSDGSIEREAKTINLNKMEITTYYQGKGVRTKSYFTEGNLLKYEEYFENGQLEYLEETHKSMTYYLQTKSFFSSGKLESSLQLTDPKKLFFIKIEYFENGNLKEKGNLYYNKSHHDYNKTGKWQYFTEYGKLNSEITYENGQIVKTVNH